MATIKDIARELGVDSSTVSLALRDHPAIAAATRERIQRAAARMNYAPNRAAQALLPCSLAPRGSVAAAPKEHP
jgi:LacI family transcriptional regulator